MRLFAALPLPPHAIERLTRLRLRLAAPTDGLRWSTPEQWHITLQFYGDTEPERAHCLHKTLDTAALSAPEITLDSLGLFAAKGILFAAIAVSPTLDALHRSVVASGVPCGFVPEARPFRPHITLARSKGRAGDRTLRALALPALPPFGPPLRWRAGECLLLESTLNPEGASYTVQARIPLG